MNNTIRKIKMNVSAISSQKLSRVKLKRRRKSVGNIKTLFNQLRRDSKSQLNSSRLNSQSQSCDTSIIELDDTSIIELDDSSMLNNNVMNVSTDVVLTGNVSMTHVRTGNVTETVRLTGNKSGNKQSNAVNTIVIKDDEPGVTPRRNYSLHHSTPIKQKPSIDDLIISINNQLENADGTMNNKTKEINASSFLTIDLTTDSGFNKSSQPTIIDLDPTNDQHDCVLTSVSQSSSMSGDSDVTVLQRNDNKRSLTSRFKSGLINLNASDKDKILTFISENLFRGCRSPYKVQPRALETAEDTYIKEVIVGTKLSRNSIGSNVYNPEKYVNKTGLRMIVIDGSNVAMAHGAHRDFSVKGLKIVIDFFLSRGHAVKAFVPRFRNKFGKSSEPQLLMLLERQGHVIFTPSREVLGRFITSYDDRYIIQCAAEFEGVIVSNDCFKDLIRENPRWAHVINTRVLQYNWVNGMIMFPRDPLGRNGPTLEKFLKMPQGNVPGRNI